MLLFLQLWKLESTYVDYFDELFFCAIKPVLNLNKTKKLSLLKEKNTKETGNEDNWGRSKVKLIAISDF